MINNIWGAMIIISVIFGFLNGRLAEVTEAVMTGAENAVTLTISLMGIMCFWSGIMKIAEDSGITLILAKILTPVMKVLFPNLKDEKAKKAIVMNIAANMLGMANAATPLGLKAVKRLKEISLDHSATDEMCMLIVINTASVQIIPSTIMALRQSAGSSVPAEIILPVWICSICALTAGVLAAKIGALNQR
ncbi:MAG: nucleoside recognition protein [Clostridia bacterium]|nr:nucleoside recognition protein [Clostridia bacterium]